MKHLAKTLVGFFFFAGSHPCLPLRNEHYLYGVIQISHQLPCEKTDRMGNFDISLKERFSVVKKWSVKELTIQYCSDEAKVLSGISSVHLAVVLPLLKVFRW